MFHTIIKEEKIGKLVYGGVVDLIMDEVDILFVRG
jgi:hypothetical protein